MQGSKKDQRQRRRGRIIELRVQGFTLAQVAETCIAEGLCPTSTFKAAFALIRYDLSRLAHSYGLETAELVPVLRRIYVERQERIYRDAYEKFQDPKCPNPAALMKIAMEAAEKSAVAQGVVTQPRQLSVSIDLDPAKEHMDRVIEFHRQRMLANFQEPSGENDSGENDGHS